MQDDNNKGIQSCSANCSESVIDCNKAIKSLSLRLGQTGPEAKTGVCGARDGKLAGCDVPHGDQRQDAPLMAATP